MSFSTGNIQDSKLKKYDILGVGQDILDKILAGKIRRYEQLTKEIDLQARSDRDKWVQAKTKPYISSDKYLILYRWEDDEKIKDRVINNRRSQ